MKMTKQDDSLHPTAERLEDWLKQNKIARIDFLKKLGIKSQKYNNWRKRGISQGEMQRIAKEAGMSYDFLRYGKGLPQISETHNSYSVNSDPTPSTRTGKTALTIKIHTVPLLSKEQIIARDFKPGDKDHTQWINPITEVSPNAFAFTTDIFNTEMERYGYEDGTTIFIDPEKPLDNGKPVLITDTHGALIIRHIERIGNTTYLCSKSPLYGPIELNESIIIIGAIAGTIKTY